MFCPHCGKEITEGQAFCQHCGAGLAEPVVSSLPDGRTKTPWEDRENVGIIKGLFKTLKEALFTPSEFFKKMAVTGGLTDPLLYALIIGMAGLMSFYFWDIMLHNSMQNFMTAEMRAMSERGMLRDQGLSLVSFLTPFSLIVSLFLSTGILHLLLLLVRGGRAGFEATFRVVAYGVSPFAFLLIPFCGMPVTTIWVTVLAIIGLKEAHGITGGKAAFAVLFPFFFCCGLMIAAMMLFMGAIAASFGSMMHWYR
jgi:hypothetical protein